jgi:hypothetical protein
MHRPTLAKIAFAAALTSVVTTFVVRTWHHRRHPGGITPQGMWLDDEVTFALRNPLKHASFKAINGNDDWGHGSFDELVDRLRRLTGAPVEVRWDKLGPAGMPPCGTARIDRTYACGLAGTIFAEFGHGPVVLRYRFEDQRVLISTTEDLGSRVIDRVYALDDLVPHLPGALPPAGLPELIRTCLPAKDWGPNTGKLQP